MKAPGNKGQFSDDPYLGQLSLSMEHTQIRAGDTFRVSCCSGRNGALSLVFRQHLQCTGPGRALPRITHCCCWSGQVSGVKELRQSKYAHPHSDKQAPKHKGSAGQWRRGKHLTWYGGFHHNSGLPLGEQPREIMKSPSLEI